ncbi:MAG: lamin tail domain-containing protein, partial [Caldilineaceae bacterium]|nr:lamin tail domain-containing protein [Caldilineaceae bacterium]
MANPSAVADDVGEWFEIFNADTVAVNLRGWQVADFDRDRHLIAADIVIAPGQYLVLARNRDSAVNGGVLVAYQYDNITLANSSDELRLLAPNGTEVDLVQWGEAQQLIVKAGASLQRTTVDSPALWSTSQSPWAGSAGDRGTPGDGYQTPPIDPTPVSPTPTPAATADGTPATPIPTEVSMQWTPASSPSALVIEEIFYRGSDDEFVVIRNIDVNPIELTGWAIGDEETPGAGEGFYELPAGYQLSPGERWIIARDGAAFRATWGQHAHAEFNGT